MVHILHIDTSGATGLVMISADGQPLALKYNETERDHAGTINHMITAVVEESGLQLTDIKAVAICSGPGSYTGLRIGMATAKGLAYALDIPLISHHKLRLLADLEDKSKLQSYLVLLPARTGEYFVLNKADYEQDRIPVHMTTDAINEIILRTNNISIFGKVEADIPLSDATDYIASDAVIPQLWSILAFKSWKENKFENIANLEPLYIKSVFIQKSKKV